MLLLSWELEFGRCSHCFLHAQIIDVAKWIKAMDCESTMRGFNSRRSPITLFQIQKIRFSIFLFMATKNKTIPIFFSFSYFFQAQDNPRGSLGSGFPSNANAYASVASLSLVHLTSLFAIYSSAALSFDSCPHLQACRLLASSSWFFFVCVMSHAPSAWWDSIPPYQY